MQSSFQSMVDSANKVVVLTGAGISTESGIPDFRGQNGTWSKDYSREYYISRDFFDSDPVAFWENYKDIFQLENFANFLPNTGHSYLAGLEHQGKQVKVYTQNADGLHQKAGSQHVFEVHGSLLKATCPRCQKTYDLSFILENRIPTCPKHNIVLSPGMVLFGDPIQYFNEAIRDLVAADLFLVLGTSLQVGPINQLPQVAEYYKIPSVLINQEATPLDSLFDVVIHEKIGSFLGEMDAANS